MQYVTASDSDGVSFGKNTTDLNGFHGKAVAQIANIAIVSTSLTSSGITAGYDALVTAVNAVIGATTQKGIVAPHED